MNEPVVKQRPSIDLDDFERRLRHASAPAPVGRKGDRHGDPLAELARLVGEPYDPYGHVFAGEGMAGHPPANQGPYSGAPRSADPYASERREPGFAGGAPRLFGDFAAIEAGLRGSSHSQHDRQFTPQNPAVPDPSAYHAHAGYSQADYAQAGHPQADQANYVQAGQPPLDGEGEWTGPSVGEGLAAEGWDGHNGRRPDTARARRPMMLMAASIAVGVIGIGAAFALKGRVSSSPREVKTIMADASPTKIQPPPDASPDGGGDGAAFGKSGQATPAKLVSREEQPVDIAQAVQDNVARAAQMNPPTDASTVPVPPSPGQMQAQASGRVDPTGDPGQGFGLAEIPAPKRVKVVSVRPDGTILPNDEPPAAAAPRQPAGKTSDRTGPVAKASTPKPVTAKTTSRVASAAKPTDKSIDSLAAGADDAPATKPVRKPKPQRVASAEPGDGTSETPAPAMDESGGGFAVQLAAPGSEADARAASSRLSKKFSDALGGHRIGFHRADSNGKPVFRVRVSSLSRADAVSLCEKLKADGGSCFVAKN